MVPLLDEEYVKSGKVYYIFKDFPILGPGSQTAALAAECAGAQGQYWPFHHWLFTNQRAWVRRGNAAQIMQGAAAELGLDAEEFAICLTSRRFQAEVQADFEEARRIGARGTPTFVINGHVLPGFMTWDRFKGIVDQMLAQETGS